MRLYVLLLCLGWLHGLQAQQQGGKTKEVYHQYQGIADPKAAKAAWQAAQKGGEVQQPKSDAAALERAKPARIDPEKMRQLEALRAERRRTPAEARAQEARKKGQ